MPSTPKTGLAGHTNVAIAFPDAPTKDGHVHICEVTLTPKGFPKPVVATYRFRLADGALVISIAGQHLEVPTGPMLLKLIQRVDSLNHEGEVPNAKTH